MGKCCNSTYRLRYWNFIDRYCYLISWMDKVATVLTVYGIETVTYTSSPEGLPSCNSTYRLRYWNSCRTGRSVYKFTGCNSTYRLRYWNLRSNFRFYTYHVMVATVLTVYGIETPSIFADSRTAIASVATVLTVYGIETIMTMIWLTIHISCNSTYRLRYWNLLQYSHLRLNSDACCNSTYRLRYWNVWEPLYRGFCLGVATVLTVYGIETFIVVTVMSNAKSSRVATVLTVYGIETIRNTDKFK